MQYIINSPPPCQDVEKDPLDRAARLKRWSLDLSGILAGLPARALAGEDWDFRGKVTRKQFDKYLLAMRACGSAVELRAPLDRQTGEMGALRVRAANYCHQHTVCPYCAGRVQDMRMRRFAEPIKRAAGRFPHAYIVTFTLPPAQTWFDGLNTVRGALQGFRRMGQRRRRKMKDGSVKVYRSPGEWGKVEGALAKIELKRGSGSGLPHVHAHALVFTNSPLDYSVFIRSRDGRRKRIIKDPADYWDMEAGRVRMVGTSKLSREWNTATGGEAWSVHVAPLKMRKRDRRKGLDLGGSILAQSLEVLKYATKFDSKPEAGREALFAEDFFQIREATYARRLFTAYGCFRGLPETEFEDDTCPLEARPIIYSATWNRRQRRYNPLAQIKAPLFPDASISDDAREKMVILNGFLGGCRRRRNAIIQTRDRFLSGAPILPDYSEVPLELPSAVLEEPFSMEAWERWVDSYDTATSERYKSLQAELKSLADARPDYIAMQKKREPWKRSREYWDQYVMSFIRILEKKPVQFDTFQPKAWKGVPDPVPL